MKFQISYPISPFSVAQPFGVNGAYYQAHGINIIGHNGLDLVAYHGQPIYATHDGTAYYEVDNNAGHGVVLISRDKFDYNDTQVNWKTIYWHMCDSSKEPQYKSPIEENSGVNVKAGDLLGYADNTGLSMGDHLHFGLKPVLSSNEPPFTWISTNPDNGYLGAIDPTDYFDGLYARDLNFRHTFDINLQFGSSSPEVMILQKALQLMGCFPSDVPFTQFYGGITRSAVFMFQRKFVAPLSWTAYLAVYTGMGSYCGALTRQALNKIFS